MNVDSHLPNFRSSTNYKVFDHLDEVPKILFNYPSIVIQKFIPEMEGDQYCVRTVSFLGDRMSPKRLIGPHPIVKGETATRADFNIETDPEIVKKIRELKFDYGKFDYVIVDNKPILLDINKTVGISPNLAKNHSIGKSFRHHADGLYQFL